MVWLLPVIFLWLTCTAERCTGANPKPWLGRGEGSTGVPPGGRNGIVLIWFAGVGGPVFRLFLRRGGRDVIDFRAHVLFSGWPSGISWVFPVVAWSAGVSSVPLAYCVKSCWWRWGLGPIWWPVDVEARWFCGIHMIFLATVYVCVFVCVCVYTGWDGFVLHLIVLKAL